MQHRTPLLEYSLQHRRKSLTNKQKQFIAQYIANGFNAKQAAVTAGYSMNYLKAKGYDLMSHPEVARKIDEAYVKVHGTHGTIELTWEWKLRKIARVINEFIPDDESVKLNSAAVKVGLFAMAELNKMTGDYAPIKKLSVNVDATKAKLAEAKKVYDEY
jgi:hypothetical protein